MNTTHWENVSSILKWIESKYTDQAVWEVYCEGDVMEFLYLEFQWLDFTVSPKHPKSMTFIHAKKMNKDFYLFGAYLRTSEYFNHFSAANSLKAFLNGHHYFGRTPTYIINFPLLHWENLLIPNY